jgi:hypothetical protein
MALLGFDDGSYVELISTLRAGTTSPWWPRQIAGDGGPCAWCVRVPDISAECARLSSLGVPVRGPLPYHRDRPDGVRVEWDLAFPGSDEPGTVLPFLIQDRTPRQLRVSPSASVRATELTGVGVVVIAVNDLLGSAQLFQQVYGWSTRETRPDPAFGATIVFFTGTPVALAAPLGTDSWLVPRLERFGESPAAFLLQSGDFGESERRFSRARRGRWLSRPALWLDQACPGGRVGIV